MFGYKLKICSCFPTAPLKDVPEKQWGELLVVHLGIHFVWKKWPEIIIHIGSRAIVNGLVCWSGAWMGKMERLGSRRSEEEACGWTYGNGHKVKVFVFSR